MTTPPATIRVTQAHIDAGQPRNCGSCPVALAVTEACKDVPGFGWAAAELDWLLLLGGNGEPGLLFKARTPPEAEQFMNRFDSYEDVDPLEFTVTWQAVES